MVKYKMSREERAKQFMPFAALKGHMEALRMREKIVVERRELSEEYKEELIKTNEVIEKITGEDVLYVRPPYGAWDKRLEAELNMFPVLWTIDPLDWCSTDVSGITRKVVTKVGEDDIILMHDYFETSVTAALEVVDELLAEGYTFVTVDEIMFD